MTRTYVHEILKYCQLILNFGLTIFKFQAQQDGVLQIFTAVSSEHEVVCSDQWVVSSDRWVVSRESLIAWT